jgi:hypothetical protein
MDLLMYVYSHLSSSTHECTCKVTAEKEIKNVSFLNEYLNLGLVAIRF